MFSKIYLALDQRTEILLIPGIAVILWVALWCRVPQRPSQDLDLRVHVIRALSPVGLEVASIGSHARPRGMWVFSGGFSSLFPAMVAVASI